MFLKLDEAEDAMNAFILISVGRTWSRIERFCIRLLIEIAIALHDATFTITY